MSTLSVVFWWNHADAAKQTAASKTCFTMLRAFILAIIMASNVLKGTTGDCRPPSTTST